MIKIFCPNCKQKLGVPDNYAGHRIRCNGCGEHSIVPKPVVSANPQPIPAPALVLQAIPVLAEVELQPSPQQLDELLLIPEDAPPPAADNLEAIQHAARERRIPTSMPPAKDASSSARDPIGAGQLAKGMGKIPLSLAIAAACIAAVIVLWVVIAKVSGFVVGYVVIGVPIAGAWGLTRFTARRGILLGLLAAAIGFFGMLAGHVAVAKWVIVPMLEKDQSFSKTMNKNFTEGFAGNSAEMPDTAVNAVAADNDEMVYVAAMSLVKEGKLDREMVKQMLLQDIQSEEPQNSEDQSGQGASVEVTPALEDAYSKADLRLVGWNDAQRKQAVRSHIVDVTKLRGEIVLTETKLGSAVTFIAAFIGSFGLLDLLWFPMGLYGAFKLASGIGDE
jgi:hypothetical protein